MISDHYWAPRGGWEAQAPDSACIFCGKPKRDHERHLPPLSPREKLYPIMFWGHAIERSPHPSDRGINLLTDIALALVTGRAPNYQPQHCVRTDVPRERRELAARLLASGKAFETYFGHAECRICGIELGCADMAGWGFLWPEKCEHYVLTHDVWVPGLDRLIERSGN